MNLPFEMEARRAEREAALDDAKCASFGAQPGTPTYYNCRMELERQRSSKGIGH